MEHKKSWVWDFGYFPRRWSKKMGRKYVINKLLIFSRLPIILVVQTVRAHFFKRRASRRVRFSQIMFFWLILNKQNELLFKVCLLCNKKKIMKITIGYFIKIF